MKIDKRALLGLICVVISLLLILILNYKSVGREPELISLSKSVAYPGDEVVLKGNHFGGEISKGRVFINDQLLFDNYIDQWKQEEIRIKLPDDFKSGMISVSNMFGTSKAHLITSIVDVPRVKTTDELPGYPFVEDLVFVEDNLLKVKGRNLGSLWGDNSLLVTYRDNVSGEEYIEIDNSRISSWADDYIDFYLPYGLTEATLFVKNSKGYSNYYLIPDLLERGVNYSYSDPRDLTLIQRVDIEDVISLKGGYINLFIPCVIKDGRQKDINFNSLGAYSKETNTFNISIETETSGESFSYILESSLVSYTQKTDIDRTLIGRKYNKKSPDYIEGFKATPGVVEDNRKLNGGAVWIVRNSNNFYNKSQLVIDWIKRYIKLDRGESSNALTAYNSRKGSEEGVVNLTVAMLRAVGIPTRKVRGINIQEEISNYSWIEFYLPKAGWVPFDVIENYKGDYTVGTIDGSRVAFSKGVKMIPYQESAFNYEVYAIQNRLDNSEGNIERYRAIWHNIDIK